MLEFTPCEAEALIEQHRKELHRFLLRRVACAETANDLLQDILFYPLFLFYIHLLPL